MAQKQNPTAMGDRVLWNALVGASTETLTLSACPTQYMIGSYRVRPESKSPDISETVARRRNSSVKGTEVLRLTGKGRAAL